jgi:8-oxo-dGTP pyrophosphatase MutT (NUDIX family)
MTTIRHFTSGAIVFDEHDRILLIHHNRIGQWLYPGGHVDPNEDPAEAALREVREETGIEAEIIGPQPFAHPTIRSVPVPFAVMEMPVRDERYGEHHHIDFVYVCRLVGGVLNALLAEVGDARWVPVAELATLDVVAELPELAAEALSFAKTYR